MLFLWVKSIPDVLGTTPPYCSCTDWEAMILLKISPSLQTEAAVSSQEDSIAKIVMPIRQKYYLVLMATTGSNLAAMDAGIIPANTPNPIQILSPRMTILGAI